MVFKTSVAEIVVIPVVHTLRGYQDEIKVNFLVMYGTLESLKTCQKKYDLFKNSQIVLFVYITQCTIPEPCEVVQEEKCNLKFDIFVSPRGN